MIQLRGRTLLKVAEEHFRQCQRTYDPNQMIALLQRYPYHVGTLSAVADLYRCFEITPPSHTTLLHSQLSQSQKILHVIGWSSACMRMHFGLACRVLAMKQSIYVNIPKKAHTYRYREIRMCRSSGQNETADDMLARCLYALEMAWPLNFRLGGCTLEYDLAENVPLFKSLFQHIRVREPPAWNLVLYLEKLLCTSINCHLRPQHPKRQDCWAQWAWEFAIQ